MNGGGRIELWSRYFHHILALDILIVSRRVGEEGWSYGLDTSTIYLLALDILIIDSQDGYSSKNCRMFQKLGLCNYDLNQYWGSGSGLLGSPGSGSSIHKNTPVILILSLEEIKLSNIQICQNNFLSLILIVIRCLDLV